MGRRRVDLQTAAELLGISSDAVRKRAKRGNMPYETGADGKLYVWVDNGETEADPIGRHDHGDQDHHRDELLEEMRDQIAFLRRELAAERSAHGGPRQLAAMLASRVRAIEPPETPQAPETPSEEPERAETPPQATGPQTAPEHRSWWRRFFGFD